MKKYRILYKERFGVDLSRAKVCEKLESLVREVELTYIPMTKKDFEQLQKRRKEIGIIK